MTLVAWSFKLWLCQTRKGSRACPRAGARHGSTPGRRGPDRSQPRAAVSALAGDDPHAGSVDISASRSMSASLAWPVGKISCDPAKSGIAGQGGFGHCPNAPCVLGPRERVRSGNRRFPHQSQNAAAQGGTPIFRAASSREISAEAEITIFLKKRQLVQTGPPTLGP